MRKIIHIDMDAFYASVELRERPELRGRPVAVGFDGPRGVVATASYVARQWGIRSAMPIARAKRLCPQLVIVPCNFALYKEVSAQVHDIFHEYTDVVEPLSLDEAFLDVTENKAGIDMAMDIAREIKGKILEQTQLTASAGVSYCKFLAKIASDYRKPDGLFVVHPARAQAFIDGLKIEDFWGVGPKTAQKMHNFGIYTGAQLRQMSLNFLTRNFGKAGKVYYDFARGIDNRPVLPWRERKSVGCEETFLEDIYEPAQVRRELDRLVKELVSRVARKEFEGRTLTLKVKFYDFTQRTRSLTVDHYITTEAQVEELLTPLLRHVPYSPDNRIRLLGLSVSKAAPLAADQEADMGAYPVPIQLSLFDWLQ